MSVTLESVINNLSLECNDLIRGFKIPSIEYNVLDKKWYMNFYKKYISKNIPVIIKQGVEEIDFTFEMWEELNPEEIFTGYLSPDGNTDGVVSLEMSDTTEDVYILPEKREITLNTFDVLARDPKANVVCYAKTLLSQMPNRFRSKIQTHIPWVSKSLEMASNDPTITIGHYNARRGVRKCFKENFFCVLGGTRDFYIIPPFDHIQTINRKFKIVQHLQTKFIVENSEILKKKFKACQYKCVLPGSFDVEYLKDADGTIETVDWLQNSYMSFLSNETFINGIPKYSVKVRKGEILYLPYSWLYFSKDTHRNLVVKYSYIPEPDLRFCYYNFYNTLCTMV